jgi:hypothetical protein
VGPELYLWSFFKNVFTEVLDTDEWMKLFDHIFTMPPMFFYYFVVAYLSYFRSALLAKHQREDLEFFFQNANPIDVNKVIKLAYTVQKHFEKRLETQKVTNPVPESVISMMDVYAVFVALPESGHQYPIPTTNYPQHAINHQLALHTRLLQQEEELLRSRQTALNQQRDTQSTHFSQQLLNEYKKQQQVKDKEQQQQWNEQRESLEEKMLNQENTHEDRLSRLEQLNLEKWMEEQRLIKERELRLIREEVEKKFKEKEREYQR